jgi:hypothetical protein
VYKFIHAIGRFEYKAGNQGNQLSELGKGGISDKTRHRSGELALCHFGNCPLLASRDDWIERLSNEGGKPADFSILLSLTRLTTSRTLSVHSTYFKEVELLQLSHYKVIIDFYEGVKLLLERL